MDELVDQKAVILEYLEEAYAGARAMDDVELMCRLGRAILAFDYDDMEHMPTWDEMINASILKDAQAINSSLTEEQFEQLISGIE